MKNLLIRLLMRLANKLYNKSLRFNERLDENRSKCIDEINRLVDEGKAYYYYDEENKKLTLKMK